MKLLILILNQHLGSIVVKFQDVKFDQDNLAVCVTWKRGEVMSFRNIFTLPCSAYRPYRVASRVTVLDDACRLGDGSHGCCIDQVMYTSIRFSRYLPFKITSDGQSQRRRAAEGWNLRINVIQIA